MIYECECPYCHKDLEIYVEIYSYKEYFYDDKCEFCGIKLDKVIHRNKLVDLDMEIMEEVSDYYVGKAEYYKDSLYDR